MKNNLYKSLFGGVIIVTLILSCFILILLLKEDKQEKITKELELMKSANHITSLYIKQNIQEAIVNDNLYLNLQAKDSVNIIRNDKPVLVFRYSALNCRECIEFGYTKLKEFFNDTELKRYILSISSDFSLEDEIHEKSHLDLKKMKLGLPIEQGNEPFFFILDGNQIKHVFIPDIKHSEYTDTYLYEIKKRYFPDNNEK